MSFKEDGYVHVKNVLSQGVCQLATQYMLFKKMNDVHKYFLEDDDSLGVPGSYIFMTDPLTESFLKFLLPVAKEHTGLNLVPSYSCFKIYQPGNVIEPHKMEPCCEITMLITLDYTYNEVDDEYKWSAIIDNKPVNIEQGEAFIYKGFDTEYERKKFDVGKDSFHIEMFLFYFDGDNPENKDIPQFAGRENIGVDIPSIAITKPKEKESTPHSDIDFEKIKHEKIIPKEKESTPHSDIDFEKIKHEKIIL